MYLVIGTRPDLAFTVSMLGTFNSNPSEEHLTLAKQVLRYVQATKHYALVYRSDQLSSPLVKMFADASYATDPDTMRSISGFILQIDGATVCWSSKRQSCVAKSTCESEYMACSYAASHLIWIKHALSELCQGDSWQLQLLTDNQAALALIKDHKISNKSKHIAVHFHYTRERYLEGDFAINHVASKNNLADVCTKALPVPLLRQMVEGLQLMDIK